MDLFGWLRRRVKSAVLGGIADAVAEIEAGDASADLDKLRAVLANADAKALPAAKESAAEEADGVEDAESRPTAAKAGAKARK